MGHCWSLVPNERCYCWSVIKSWRLSVPPWSAPHQAPLSSTISQSLLKLISIELVMLSYHLILCRPLLLLPSTFCSTRVFTKESALRIRWPWEIHRRLKANFRGVPWWSSGWGSALSLPVDWVQSLVKELRSCKPCVRAKKRFNCLWKYIQWQLTHTYLLWPEDTTITLVLDSCFKNDFHLSMSLKQDNIFL